MLVLGVVIIAYLIFTGFVVWWLAKSVPGAMGRVLLAVAVLVAGLPAILHALSTALGG
ncbi:hypothetical protein [Umezawaea beigongshangensis]|uniref:hypothetical protein n=1 Tax=Umezawaea beigongshangensis TaxID=2780383 RepID=UPI0018F16CA9|nr:hypothetical protein [Umezawaea beigongshangensis]